MSAAVDIPVDAVALVDKLLHKAREIGASDLHLDPGPQTTCVRARRDGVLTQVQTLPTPALERVVGRLKTLADLLVYRTDVPQEGRITCERSATGDEVRVATFPSLYGERVALRFPAPDVDQLQLADLLLDGPVRDALRVALAETEGVVLLTGPSGSGKTSTLYGCLAELAAHDSGRCLVSVEDPIERHVDGVVQSQVQPAVGMDFARALRSLLRQDPDVIMVGEIRDAQTAKCVCEAGLTGHLVLSTLHAGTAPRVFARLLEMGIEPFVLTSVVRGVLAQRLLRRVCEKCQASEGKASCAACQGTGYAGRILIASWLPMTEEFGQAVMRRADSAELTAVACASGMQTLREAASDAVAAGLTTVAECVRVLGRRS